MTTKLRIVNQGASIYVMGTNEIAEAAKALPPEVRKAGWGSSHPGPYIRRQGLLRGANPEPYTQKGARPGVCFYGVKA
jgi:hypothetical protein